MKKLFVLILISITLKAMNSIIEDEWVAFAGIERDQGVPIQSLFIPSSLKYAGEVDSLSFFSGGEYFGGTDMPVFSFDCSGQARFREIWKSKNNPYRSKMVTDAVININSTVSRDSYWLISFIHEKHKMALKPGPNKSQLGMGFPPNEEYVSPYEFSEEIHRTKVHRIRTSLALGIISLGIGTIYLSRK